MDDCQVALVCQCDLLAGPNNASSGGAALPELTPFGPAYRNPRLHPLSRRRGGLLGTFLARQAGLPEILPIHVGGRTFPVIWSIIGAALFAAVLALIKRPRR